MSQVYYLVEPLNLPPQIWVQYHWCIFYHHTPRGSWCWWCLAGNRLGMSVPPSPGQWRGCDLRRWGWGRSGWGMRSGPQSPQWPPPGPWSPAWPRTWGIHYQMSVEMGWADLLQFSITVDATKPGELSSPYLTSTNYLTGAMVERSFLRNTTTWSDRINRGQNIFSKPPSPNLCHCVDKCIDHTQL